MPEIISGKNPVLEALKAGRPLNKILLSKSLRNDAAIAEILRCARDRGIPVEFLERQAIDRQSLTNTNQGVLAYTASKDYVTLDDLLAIPKKTGEPALFCVLDGIEDPMNLGAILRTAGATGVQGVIVRSRRAVGLTAVVAKASAGAIEYVPVARVANIAETIEKLKKNNIWVIGIDMDGKTDFEKVDFKLPSAIVIGGEGKGLSPLVRKRCDTIARIPMKGQISSLNASVAAALVMYAAFRQRTSP
ncbi:MAG: 23S rRNA (guanosine(2251)-2'-O)-methyltransferase RlmB [Chloroflexi bacterium RBG_16_51_9]|nr:MAG: 23S rRNA (guanosine(2251)-2'-O)-methyltransferase RlmB [Chloroflexi bacterium RBG_16_51_9]